MLKVADATRARVGVGRPIVAILRGSSVGLAEHLCAGCGEGEEAHRHPSINFLLETFADERHEVSAIHL